MGKSLQVLSFSKRVCYDIQNMSCISENSDIRATLLPLTLTFIYLFIYLSKKQLNCFIAGRLFIYLFVYLFVQEDSLRY